MASLMPKTMNYSLKTSKSNIAKSYLLGQKKGLSRKIKKAHHKLHLLHLMTPSGLHLSVALLIFKKYFKKKIILQLLLLLISIMTLFMGDYNALRRMAIFGLTKNFIVTFIIDFFLGGWHQSPFSFALSFLFLGLILINKNNPKKILARDFFIAQILIAYFFQQQVYPIGFFIGFFLTPIISSLFPLYLIDFLFPGISPISKITEAILLFFCHFTFEGVSPFIALFFLSLFYIPYFLPFCFLLWPEAITNLPKHHLNKKAFHSPAPANYKSIKRTRSGYILAYDNDLLCRMRLYSSGWSTRCKFKKH
jgi:competence protein ComEC